MSLKVIEFPDRDVGAIPATLRRIADGIEAGEFGAAHHLAWVIDQGDGEISVGLCGHAPEPALTTYFLLGLGMRKMERV